MAEEEPAFKRRKGKEIVQLTKTVEFKLKAAGFLREALAPMTDTALNPLCMAMVEVTTEGVQITVRNENTNVFARLFLKSFELIDFHCTQTLVPHMMYLGLLSDFLIDVHANEIIEIYHIDGSDYPQLFFIANLDELHVDLLKVVNANPPRFPDSVPDCTAPITTDILKEIIQHLEKEPHNSVMLEVKRKIVIVSVGEVEQSNNWVRWEIDSVAVKTEVGMEHHATFGLPYLGAISKASVLDPEPVLYLINEPESIMVQFRFIGHGEVMFFFKANMVATAPDLDSPGADAAAGSHPFGTAAGASQLGGGAVEASQPEGTAAEALLPGGDAADASRPV